MRFFPSAASLELLLMYFVNTATVNTATGIQNCQIQMDLDKFQVPNWTNGQIQLSNSDSNYFYLITFFTILPFGSKTLWVSILE